jgi:tetraacyldisaccharide 4'-kinase
MADTTSDEAKVETTHDMSCPPSGGLKVLAVAGIANPHRFVDALRAAGHIVAGEMTFADHHRYTAADVAAIDARMKAAGADAIVTTDKDAVRLETLALPMPAYRVPLTVTFDPPDVLFASVRAVLDVSRART